jgi:hypothetical protein
MIDCRLAASDVQRRRLDDDAQWSVGPAERFDDVRRHRLPGPRLLPVATELGEVDSPGIEPGAVRPGRDADDTALEMAFAREPLPPFFEKPQEPSCNVAVSNQRQVGARKPHQRQSRTQTQKTQNAPRPLCAFVAGCYSVARVPDGCC